MSRITMHGIARGAALAAALAAILAATASTARAAEPDVAIVSPYSEETVHDNTGHVAVTIALGGQADLQEGERIQLLVDGNPAGRAYAGTQIDLEDVERGTHILQALLVDREGRTLASSEPVTFHMWQASRLFPGRKGR